VKQGFVWPVAQLQNTGNHWGSGRPVTGGGHIAELRNFRIDKSVTDV